MIRLLMVLLSVNLFAYNVENFKDEMSNDITKIQNILKENSEDKNEKLFDLLKNNLDLDLMTRLVLSKHAKDLEHSKLTEFKQLFINKLKKDFSSKIELVNGSSLKLIDTKHDDKKCEANMQVNYEDQEKELSFKFRKTQNTNECKLYDIEVLNTSLIASYRAEFLDIIKQGGINSLFEKLK